MIFWCSFAFACVCFYFFFFFFLSVCCVIFSGLSVYVFIPCFSLLSFSSSPPLKWLVFSLSLFAPCLFSFLLLLLAGCMRVYCKLCCSLLFCSFFCFFNVKAAVRLCPSPFFSFSLSNYVYVRCCSFFATIFLPFLYPSSFQNQQKSNSNIPPSFPPSLPPSLPPLLLRASHSSKSSPSPWSF